MKQVAAILAVLLVMLGASACATGQTDAKVEELLRLGEQYFLELDHEQALAQFLQVIELEPRNPRGYTGAADAYLGLGDPDSALQVLEAGYALTGDAAIAAMIEDLYSNRADIQADEPDQPLEEQPPADEFGENISGAAPFQVQDLLEWGPPLGMTNKDDVDAVMSQWSIRIAFSGGLLNTVTPDKDISATVAGPRGIRLGDDIHKVLSTFMLRNQSVLDIVQASDYERADDWARLYEYQDGDMVYKALLHTGDSDGYPGTFKLRYEIYNMNGTDHEIGRYIFREYIVCDMQLYFTPDGVLDDFALYYR